MELLHQRLGYRSTITLLTGDTVNVWKYIEIRVDPDPFFTSCQISLINKNLISETPLKSKRPFKWVFMDTTPSISSKILTKDTTFTNYLLIVDTYSKLPIIYGMEDITTEKVMYKIDMFQASFGKLYGFGWWDLE